MVSMNPAMLAEQAKDMSEMDLAQAAQYKNPGLPPYIAVTELSRRKRLRDSFAAKDAPQTTVVQDMVAAAGAPAGGISDIARNMAPKTDMQGNTGAQPMPQERAAAPNEPMRMAEGGRLPGRVERRPRGAAGMMWDRKYGETHFPDGEPKSVRQPDMPSDIDAGNLSNVPLMRSAGAYGIPEMDNDPIWRHAEPIGPRGFDRAVPEALPPYLVPQSLPEIRGPAVPEDRGVLDRAPYMRDLDWNLADVSAPMFSQNTPEGGPAGAGPESRADEPLWSRLAGRVANVAGNANRGEYRRAEMIADEDELMGDMPVEAIPLSPERIEAAKGGAAVRRGVVDAVRDAPGMIAGAMGFDELVNDLGPMVTENVGNPARRGVGAVAEAIIPGAGTPLYKAANEWERQMLEMQPGPGMTTGTPLDPEGGLLPPPREFDETEGSPAPQTPDSDSPPSGSGGAGGTGGGGAGGSAVAGGMSEEETSKWGTNEWLALAYAGLSMMDPRVSFAEAVSKGGIAGLEFLMTSREKEDERRLKEEELALRKMAAMRGGGGGGGGSGASPFDFLDMNRAYGALQDARNEYERYAMKVLDEDGNIAEDSNPADVSQYEYAVRQLNRINRIFEAYTGGVGAEEAGTEFDVSD